MDCIVFQHSGLENSVDCIVHGVARSQTGLSDFHCVPLCSLPLVPPGRPVYVRTRTCTSLTHMCTFFLERQKEKNSIIFKTV